MKPLSTTATACEAILAAPLLGKRRLLTRPWTGEETWEGDEEKNSVPKYLTSARRAARIARFSKVMTTVGEDFSCYYGGRIQSKFPESFEGQKKTASVHNHLTMFHDSPDIPLGSSSWGIQSSPSSSSCSSVASDSDFDVEMSDCSDMQVVAIASRSTRFALNQFSCDLLQEVFSFMDYTDVCATIAPVCQQFHNVSCSSSFLNNVSGVCFGQSQLQSLLLNGNEFAPVEATYANMILQLLAKLKGLQVLKFCDSILLDDRLLQVLGSQNFPLLKSLRIQWCSQVSDVGIEKFLASCPRLEEFVLMKGRALIVPGETSILRVTDKTLRNVTGSCPLIQAIDLYCTQVSEQGKIF
jgi:hypothetical protein